MKRQFIVTMHMPDTSITDVKGFIKNAVDRHGEKLEATDPMWNGNWNNNVKVTAVPLRKNNEKH